MADTPRTLIAQLVQAGDRSHEEHVNALHALARRMSEAEATFSLRQFERWLVGGVGKPRSATRRVLEAYFQRTIEALFGPARGHDEIATTHEAPTGGPGALHDLEGLAMSAAHASSEHSAFVSTHIEDTSIVDLQERVIGAARRYSSCAPIAMFAELMRIRDHAWRLLEQTKRPRQQQDLYVVAGQACALLATITFDLGYPAAAAEQARAATMYAKVTDQRTLAAFGQAIQSTIAFWTGEPRRGVYLASIGLEQSDRGTVAVRLHGLRARSFALQGMPAEAKYDLQKAAQARQSSGDDELCDSIGGEYAFSEARLALCSAASYVALQEGDAVVREARRALDLFADLPESEQRFSVQYGARLDLVAGLVLQGDLRQALDEMQPVAALPPAQRTERLTQRVHSLRISAMRPQHRTQAGQQLREMMEDFVAGADRPALPAAPGLTT